MQINTWQNCYSEGWKDIIMPASFQHPAKMLYGLLKRILAHAKEQGWLKEGDVIVDPFGGIGSTGILGAYEGYQCVCCELEQKFVDLAEQNFKLHDHAWQKFGNPRPIMIQGDSRKLCEVVEKADCIVSSPPYQEQVVRKRDIGKGNQGATGGKHCFDEYGISPGQLGAMKPGNVDMVVKKDLTNNTASTMIKGKKEISNDFETKTSCGTLQDRAKLQSDGTKNGLLPSSGVETIATGGLQSKTETKQKEVEQPESRNRISLSSNGYEPKPDSRIFQRSTNDDSKNNETVGDSPIVEGQAQGQAASELQGRQEQPSVSDNDNKGQVPEVQHNEQSGDSSQEQRPLRPSAGKSGNSMQFLPLEHNQKEMVDGQESRATDTEKQCPDRLEQVSLICSNPPYEGIEIIGGGQNEVAKKEFERTGIWPKGDISKDSSGQSGKNYVGSSGQLGNTKGDTFWSAAKIIVQQCYQILKPGGHAIWVLKAFVRNKKIVDFPGDWQRLCESVGFKTVCIHHAMLVKETEHKTLFGHTEVKRKERKSFFRRLAESKGSPRIDFEVVLCMEK